MIQKGIVLILALGAAAEVPHWMAPVHTPSFESILEPVMSLRRKMEGQIVTSGRRLQAIMSEECKAACPGAQDMVMKMMEMATQETTPPPEGMDPTISMMMSMCSMADTLVCVGTERVCMDEEPSEDDDPAAIKCLCECPKFMTAAMKMGEGDYKPLCDNKASTVDCVMGKTECASVTKEMSGGEIDLACKMSDAGCIEKLTSCKTQGEDWEKSCELASEDKAKFEAESSTCCPLAKEMTSCQGQECLKLAMAGMAMDKDKADKEMAKMDNIRTVCPDASIPTQAEAEAAASGSGGSGDSGDAAAGAASGQAALSMAAITTAMIAVLA